MPVNTTEPEPVLEEPEEEIPEIEPEPTPEPEPIPEPIPEPEPTQTNLEFGKPDAEYGFSWPDENEIELIDKSTSDWRISQINYKIKFNEFSLSLIQFVFENGIVAQACAAEKARDFDTLY